MTKITSSMALFPKRNGIKCLRVIVFIENVTKCPHD